MVPLARVGKEAPDFEATTYIPGVGFKLVKLSDYRGKWVVLCFYPGDFTLLLTYRVGSSCCQIPQAERNGR